MNNKPDYSARKISSTIVVDGNLKKEVWLNAQWSKRFVDMVTGDPGMYNTQTAIPWTSLQLLANGRSIPPEPGDKWNLFLGRFQKLMSGGIEVQPHPAMALNSHGIYDTHLPDKWSRIEFAQ